MPGQQLIENYAEAVNVADESNRQCLDLFRTGVFQRHQAHAQSCFRGGIGHEVRVKQLCNSKVEQLGHTTSRNQNITRLDVAMDDELLVRVVDRITNL